MSKRILVIDDDEAIRKSFSLTLEDTEYQVDTAESGEKGLEMEKEDNYDLIYLDLKMPGMNGTEVLREIRKIDNAVPVYIVTAFHTEFMAELKELRNEGIRFELLQKPVESDDIITITNAILN